jgi:hypothetical protein
MGQTLTEILITEIEERIRRACKTIRALPDRERRFLKVESGWPDYVRDAAEAYGYNEADGPRFRPTPADVGDCLTALAWARGINKQEFRLVWLRSHDLSFGTIGRILGKSDETARRYYRDVMVKLWGIANREKMGTKPKNIVASVASVAV